ncbi:hypothetical protein [Cupriavidus campinensis]|nr:hypothetical protein [Cupriavidus campinensis]
MQRIENAVAWRMFVRYGLDLLFARSLVSKLHFNELAIAGLSLEEKLRRIAELDASRGVIRDEMGYYAGAREPWPEQTPDLLRKDIPPYKWAIYPDRRVFLWSKLVSQIEMLPEDFAEDLRQAGKLGNGSDAVVSFMMDSFVPAACQPLKDALASGALTASVEGPRQWTVKWIVTKNAEVLGCCIVAEKLGGIIPRVFAPDGGAAYAALADLLCGEVVPADLTAEQGDLVTEHVWFIERSRLEQLKAGRRSDLLDSLWYHDQFPHSVELYRGQEGCRLAGQAEFSERGQAYLATSTFDAMEQQRMLREGAVFETFELSQRLVEEVGTERGIPSVGNRWHDAVEHMFAGRSADVEAVMGSPAGVDALMAAVLANISASELDVFVDQAISECLPVRYEGHTEDDDDLVNDRRSALSNVDHLGSAVLASMPSLNSYSAVSLGYMMLVAEGEYPGSRYQGMVNALAPTEWARQSRLLAAMLIFDSKYGSGIVRRALLCAIAPVLGTGTKNWSKAKIGMWYQSACAAERRLTEGAAQLKAVQEWRGVEVEAERVRSHGKFLRSGDPIPATKPKSPAEALNEMFSMTRSSSVFVIQAKQDFTSMQEGRR